MQNNVDKHQWYLFEHSYNSSKQILETATGRLSDINLSSIATILIQNVGELVEHYASDFLIDWEKVLTFFNNKAVGTEYVLFGLRENGVDSNNYIFSNQKSHATQSDYIKTYYKKVFAMKMTIDDEGYSTAELRDITDTLVYWDEENGRAVHNDMIPRDLYIADRTIAHMRDNDGIRAACNVISEYPEISFLCGGFNSLYEQYCDSQKACELFSELENIIVSLESVAYGNQPDKQCNDDICLCDQSAEAVITDWFYGRFDPDFYYCMLNDYKLIFWIKKRIEQILLTQKETDK